MEKLFTLLEVQRKALEASSRAELLHIIVNDTFTLIPYEQAIFWKSDLLGISIEKTSGNLDLDPDSPYANALKDQIKSILGDAAPVQRVAGDMVHGTILKFMSDDGTLCGLFLQNKEPVSDPQMRILDELCLTYSKALMIWSLKDQKSFFVGLKTSRSLKKGFLLLVCVVFLFPVRLGVSAPAEIVAKDVDTISAPYTGMIEKIHVDPGDPVKQGDIIVTMEKKTLEGQMNIAEQELSAAQAAFSRLQRESLVTPEKKPNLLALREEIENKKIAYDYAKTLKERAEIKSPRDGIAVFSDLYSLRGKPIDMGTKIMMIADTGSYDLLIRVPVDAMIRLDDSAKIIYHLNVSPLIQKTARIEKIGYQASIDPDGLMTYKIKASVEDEGLRIGWKGSARISTGWTIMGYAILRRPINALRLWMGF
jgi:hypothetical protein